jgi:hypothetical protein
MRDRRETSPAFQSPVFSAANDCRRSGTRVPIRDWCNGADPDAGIESLREALFKQRDAGLHADRSDVARLLAADREPKEDGA